MRELLSYPVLSMDLMAQVQAALRLLRLELTSTGEALSEEGQIHLNALYKLIRKEVALQMLHKMMNAYELSDLAGILLQPKAPAAFDLELDELIDIVMLVYQKETPLYQKEYYLELLQKSLLLSQIDELMPPLTETLTKEGAESLAQTLLEEGKDASELIVI